MTAPTSRMGFSELWRQSPYLVIRIVLAAGLVGLVIAVLGIIITSGGGGDEAPIRVKSGSIELKVLADNSQADPQDWNKVGNTWKIKNSHGRHKNRFQLFVVSSNQTTMCNGKYWGTTNDGGEIQLTYDNQDWVKLTADGGHASITSSNSKLLKRPSEQLLQYGDPGTGYLSEILVDGASLCKFPGKDDLLFFAIVDF